MADKSITKTELVASIASATGQSQSAVSGVLDSLFATVSEAVAKGSKVSIPGWIAFERVETSARTGRNPQTGEEIKIPAGQRSLALSKPPPAAVAFRRVRRFQQREPDSAGCRTLRQPQRPSRA